MPKRLGRTTYLHVNLFDEDLEFLREHYGPRSDKGMAINEIVRTIVHDTVKGARTRLREVQDGQKRRMGE